MDSFSADAIIAQLMGMGFEQENIMACLLSMKSSGSPVTLQSTTDFLLQQQPVQPDHTQIDMPTLRLANDTTPTSSSSDELINQPVSTRSTFTSSHVPVKSRHDYGEEKRRQRDEYDVKERDEAVKKAREIRMKDHRAKEIVRQQIAEDRQRKAERSKPSGITDKTVVTSETGSDRNKAGSDRTKAGSDGVKATPNQCRVQVRLLNGKMIRNSFLSSSTLNDVCQYLQSTNPSLKVKQLVQPFPHKEFTIEEHTHTLQQLGLCPSASLVVSKNTQREPSPQEPMDISIPDEEEIEEMDKEEEEEPSLPSPHPTPPGMFPPGGRGLPPPVFPPPGAGGGLPPPVRMPHPPINVPQPGVGFPGFNQPQPVMSFGGAGHKLGGKDVPVQFINPQEVSKSVSESALAAAEKRAKMLKEIAETSRVHSSAPTSFPSLEVLTLRCLARWSSVNYLPSCSSLPPRIAQRLITALAEAKQLHPKTLSVFLKCPLQMIVLDNYTYTTNQLIEMLRYFSSLNHLSLVSCTLLTDKSMGSLLPYLPNLQYLNLNGCHQLSDDIFHSFKGYQNIEVMKLSKTKVTDKGVRLLLRKPLQCLKELDLSYTNITHHSLSMLAEGAKCLRTLNIECTKVCDVASLLSLPNLCILNVAQCKLEGGRTSTLSGCQNITSLSLSQIPMDYTEFARLRCLPLSTLSLPDRNVFFDDHMTVVSGFPITELNLTGYCNVTDYGIKHIQNIYSLTNLSLSRTKLTDEGMVYVKGLINLKQLTLDNTTIADTGMEYIRDLENIEQLSLSDTRVTSQFIINGCLNKMNRLSKLNLVRTFVDDKGLLVLSIPSLMMLSIDFTCATEAVTIETLRNIGCRSLELFRSNNIRQPTEIQQQQQQQQQQGNIGAVVGGGVHAFHQPPPLYDSDIDEDSD